MLAMERSGAILYLLQQATWRNKMYSNAQLADFTQKLEREDVKVHEVEVQGELMLAHTERGCAYCNGTDVLQVEGEQSDGDLYKNNEMWGAYELVGAEVVITLEHSRKVLRYSHTDEGWEQMAKEVLAA